MFSKLIVTAVAILALSVGPATAAPTPQGLKADAGVGLAAGLGVAALGGVTIVFARRTRRAGSRTRTMREVPRDARGGFSSMRSPHAPGQGLGD